MDASPVLTLERKDKASGPRDPLRVTNSYRAEAENSSASNSVFTDSRKRYQLQPPAGWIETSKPGADALFQDPHEKGTTLGVTVTPVRIASLDQFGSVEQIAGRLLGAERAKVLASYYGLNLSVG